MSRATVGCVAEFRRSKDGVWTLHLDETDKRGRNDLHDDAVPRYVDAFDAAFAQAQERCEAEFVKALLRVWKMQDAGWDPYETTLRAIPAMAELHELIPRVSSTTKCRATLLSGRTATSSKHQSHTQSWPTCSI